VRRLSFGELEKPEHGSEPQRLGRIAIDGERVVARPAEGRCLAADGERECLAVAEPKHEGFRRGENQALVVFVNGRYVELGYAPFARVGGEPSIPGERRVSKFYISAINED